MSYHGSGGRPHHTQGEVLAKGNGLGELANLSAKEVRQFMEDNFPGAVPEEQKEKPAIQRRIVIGTLSYDGKMHCKHAFALLQAGFAIAKAGYELSFVLREGDSMVARGRNVLLAKFLEDPKNTDLVLCDTDLDFSPEDFMKLVEARTSDGKLCDVVAGCYPYKDGSGQFPLRWPIDGLFDNNGLWEVMAVTPGFLKLSRDCLERMTHQLPHLSYVDNALGDGRTSWMLFDNACRQNGVYDEGYIFCELWRQVGGKVYIDPTVNVSHIGTKSYNHGTVINWLERTAENVQKLKADFPHIPDLDREKFNRKYSDSGKTEAAQVGTGAEPAKDGTRNIDDDGERGRGRPTDLGFAEAVAKGLTLGNFGKTEGGLPGPEVRPGAD